jgi:hypothetical protein
MINSLSAYHKDPKITFKDQEQGETILLLLRRHLITNVWWLLTALALSFLPVVILFGRVLPPALDPALLPGNYTLVALLTWYLFVFGFVIINFLDWFFNVDLVTNKRLVDMDYVNLLFFKSSETNYSKIEDVSYHVSGLFQVSFNFGDVSFQTAGTQENFDLTEIPNPAGVHDLITDLMTTSPS